jgi:hypothetical protein
VPPTPVVPPVAQGPVAFEHWPLPGSQLSAVHGSPSSQSALEAQHPLSCAWTQRCVAGLQVSVVQALASAQSPSSAQQPTMIVLEQFPPASQASFVHALPSSQSVACAQQPPTACVMHT